MGRIISLVLVMLLVACATAGENPVPPSEPVTVEGIMNGTFNILFSVLNLFAR